MPENRENPAEEVAQGTSTTSNAFTAVKLLAAAALFYSAGLTFAETYHHMSAARSSAHDIETFAAANNNNNAYSYINWDGHGRRLSSEAKISKENPPSYMKDLFEDLKARTKLMEETPPAEVKYWFEYTGPLQVSCLRHCFGFCHIITLYTRYVMNLQKLGNEETIIS